MIKKGDSEYVVVVSGSKDTGKDVWRKLIYNLFIFEIPPCKKKGKFVTEFVILDKIFTLEPVCCKKQQKKKS